MKKLENSKWQQIQNSRQTNIGKTICIRAGNFQRYRDSNTHQSMVRVYQIIDFLVQAKRTLVEIQAEILLNNKNYMK